MKTTIPIFLMTLALSSCQAPVEGSLGTLAAERDSLKGIVSDHNARITEINKIIAESDSSFVNKLTLVESHVVEIAEFSHFFEIYGQVETDKNALLFAETPGLINSIPVREGQRVSRGAVIASIDSQIIQSQISEVETSYSLAVTTFEKQERLWKKKIGSEMQYLQAKNRKESMESTLGTLRSQLAKARVKAPFSGVVDEIFPNQGEMASPQMPIARVVNLDRMYIKSEVSENHLGSVSKGTAVQVEFPSLKKTLDATLSEASNYINPENRSFKVRVDLPKSELALRPNQLAHIRINDYRNEKAISLSSSIILQSSSGEDFVYVMEEKEGKSFAVKRIVQLGMEYNGRVEIESGLKEGDMVIGNGAKSVRDGQRVRSTTI